MQTIFIEMILLRFQKIFSLFTYRGYASPKKIGNGERYSRMKFRKDKFYFFDRLFC